MQSDQAMLPTVAVIIPAAGIGSRMNSSAPKQFLPIGTMPVLARSCGPFLEMKEIQYLIIAVHPEFQEETKDIIYSHLPKRYHAKIRFAVGGAERQDSVLAALALVPDNIEIVLVHDAARPLIDKATIQRTITGAQQSGAVIAAVPVKDTLKKADENNRIQQTIDRSNLYQAQTPQAAKTHLLREAFVNAAEKNFSGTDEASLLEQNNIPVHIVSGNENNIKITHPEDITFARHFFQQETVMKIGHGYDAHQLVENRPLVLGGERIDYHLGLAGHSDADVLCHALTDAILGALGRGDIGKHFPDTDKRFKDISSLLLLEEVIQQAHEDNLVLANADITVICQKPKLAPYLELMKKNLTGSCRVDQASINIKATTTEKMGFTGRGEGIAAHAVVLMRSIS